MATQERCGRQLVGDHNGTLCCCLPFMHTGPCEQEDTPSGFPLTGPGAGFEMMLYRYPTPKNPVEVPGGMWSQWWTMGTGPREFAATAAEGEEAAP